MLNAVLIVVIAFGAQLEPPTPSTVNTDDAAQEQSKPAQKQAEVLIGTEAVPAVVRIAKSPEEAAQEQTDRERDTTNQLVTIGLTTALAIFTLALVYVGWKQRETYEATLAANKVIERAYVDMAHTQPGLIIGPNPGPDGTRTIECQVAIRNMGNTPARVIDANIFSWHEPLPESPPHAIRAAGTNGAFLVRSKKYFVRADFSMPEVHYQAVRKREQQMLVLGFVEYLDRFDKRHRALYARRYEPTEDDLILGMPPEQRKNNLVFEGKQGYNDDKDLPQERSRATSEG